MEGEKKYFGMKGEKRVGVLWSFCSCVRARVSPTGNGRAFLFETLYIDRDFIPDEGVIQPLGMDRSSKCDTWGLVYVSSGNFISEVWTSPKWRGGGRWGCAHLSPIVVIGVKWIVNKCWISDSSCGWKSWHAEFDSRLFECLFFALLYHPKSLPPPSLPPAEVLETRYDSRNYRKKKYSHERGRRTHGGRQNALYNAHMDFRTGGSPLPT